MRDDFIHAAVTVACATLIVLSAVFAGGFLSLAAPVSGEAWGPAYGANDGSVADTAVRTATGAKRVENPYGTATVRYDDDGVPHVTASNERALAFAIGYVHARDRLFQMDLQRRLMAGNLSAAFGSQAVESDTFHRKMGFEDAAEASWEAIQGTDSGESVSAYTEGVNRYVDSQPLPLEFRLNGYEPTRWEEEDTLLVGKLIAWQLTGDFRDLKQQTIERRLPESASLYPRQLDHGSAIVDRAVGGEGVTGAASMSTDTDRPSAVTAPTDGGRAVGDMRALYESLAPYQTEPGIGSNSWVVSGEHTRSGKPIVANDPHLSLTVPPVWYEQHLVVEGSGSEPSLDVRGVAFPGLPVVVIGQNREVSWGFTNVGADQTDLYSYVRPSEDTYLYEGEEREIERTTETIPVKDGEDVQVTIERTVHGPLIEREGEEVAVSWLGLAGTREAQGIRGLNYAEDIDDVEAAIRLMDTPTQNIVAADSDGGTYFRITGRYPIRTVEGERTHGQQVFNGSAGHGEWEGWEPYGQVDWDGPGFVDFEDVPHVRNPEYLATANQRTMDDPPFYISYSPGYADPYRGKRIYGHLDRQVESDEPVTREFMQALQRNVRSEAAREFKPIILDATGEMEPETRLAARELEDFRGRMRRGSEDALLYALFRDHYRNATFYDEYHPAGLDGSYYPKYSTLARLPADSEWFDDERTPETETRADIVARAMRLAVEERERRGLETYADYNVVDVNHPFPVEALDYPEAPTDGSLFTVSNFRVNRGTQAGSSWRMVATFGSPSVGIIPGGQSGNYFSPHYADQMDEWRDGEYRELTFEVEGKRAIVFEDGGDEE